MADQEVFYENYYLDEEEIISYTNNNEVLFKVIKSKEFIEKCIKYLNDVVNN